MHYSGPTTPASMEYKIFIWQPRWNMISPVIFAGALTIFAGALPPWVPPWWQGRRDRYNYDDDDNE